MFETTAPGTLDGLLRREGPLPAARAVAIVEQLAAALDAAHAQGLVHGAVTPAAVLVLPGSPERVQLAGPGAGGPPGAGPADDVHDLARVLFELLTGAPAGHPVPSVRAYRGDLPPAVDAAIAAGTAPDPRSRFASAGAFAAAARAALLVPLPRAAPTTVHAPPPYGLTAPAPAPGRRPPVVALVAAALLLAGIVAAGVVYVPRGLPRPATAAPVAAAPVSRAPSPDAPAAPSAVGTWVGTYQCAQGKTGLRLVVTGTDPRSLTAVFQFFPVAGNADVPSGRFAMSGSQSGRQVRLRHGDWIDRPPGYLGVDLLGEVAADRGTLTGVVQADGAGCTTFGLVRR